MSVQPTAAVPSMLQQPPMATRMVTVRATDHFTPMVHLPSQPSPHQVVALMQPVGVVNVPRAPPTPPRPKKHATQCTWQGDVLVLLQKDAEFDVPDYEELLVEGYLPKLPFTLDATLDQFHSFVPGDGVCIFFWFGVLR